MALVQLIMIVGSDSDDNFGGSSSADNDAWPMIGGSLDNDR